MPAVARKSGVDQVYSPHGDPPGCSNPSIQATDTGSSRVFVQGIGVVRRGDIMTAHPTPDNNCNPHAPSLDVGSIRVFSEGLGIGRIGDMYGGEHPILTGSTRVFAG